MQAPHAPRYLLVANPKNRRVSLFTEALREAEHPAPDVVSWQEYLSDASALSRHDEAPRHFRIDSFGEDFEVERLLLERGGFPDARTVEERKGEVLEPAVSHRGFVSALRSLDELLRNRPSWKALNVPKEIEEFFDKRTTSRRFLAAGIPVPEFLEDVPATSEAVLEAAAAREWGQFFVKPTMGSSASMVLLVSVGPRGPEIRTSLEWAAPRWFNNLKLRHYVTPRDVKRALDFVLSQGAQVERAVPKAKLGGAFFDCRVVCIAGEPRFVIVRQNEHPITNLHLGGWRGDLEKLRAALTPGAWDAAMETCRTVARLYRSLHIGLDVMFEPDLKSHRVIEANAFGDLLPNATVDGRSVYRWEIDEAAKSR